MSERVTMPALGESVTEGTVTRWLKSVGDQVEVDEPLLEVSTDKVDTEIPSPVAGALQEILVEEDDTVPVGADLAVIGDGDAPAASGSGDDDASAGESGQQSSQESGQQSSQESGQQSSQESGQQPSQEPAAQEPEAPSTEQPAPDTGPDEPTEQPEPASSGDAGGSSGSGGAGDSSGSGGSGGDGQTITMPALGESVTEGTVTRWLKAEGDEVEVDEPLLEVSTDKVDTEIPSPAAGTLTKILVPEDETVPVGADLAVIGGSGGGGGGGSAPESAPAEASAAESQSQPESQPGASGQADSAEEQPDAGSSPAEAAEDSSSSQPTPDAAEATAPKPDSAPSSSAPSASAPSSSAPPASAPARGASAPSAPEPSSGSDASAYVTPLVRKLAADNGIDLGSVTGTGIGGRIRKQDVLDATAAKKAEAEKAEAEKAAAQAPASAAQQAPAAPAPAAPAASASAPDSRRGTTEKMSRLRQTIAKRMVESLQVSAQLTSVVEVDVTKIARLRARAKGEFERREGVKLSFLPFFALAAVEALKSHPVVNSSIEGTEVTYHGAEHLGVAVDTERGLLVPVIRDAGDLNIAGLSRKIADLAERTRTNKITPDELGGGTFTLTNTGSRGALFDTPIINQPQVAILGTGAVVKRPVVVADADGGETIAIRSTVYLALSYDHRIVDGADAARFLTTIKARLEEGRFEAQLGLR